MNARCALPLLVLLPVLSACTQTQPLTDDGDRRLLGTSYSVEALRGVLIAREDWRPFPSMSAPEGLERVPEAVQAAYIREAEQLLDEPWAPFPATVFLEYVRTGNRSNYEALSFGRRQRLATLVLAEVFEREGRFLDQIVNGIWAVCEESFWGVPAHLGQQEAGPGLPDVAEPSVDLFAAETGALLAWTVYLLGPQLDALNPLVTRRITLEAERRLLTPYLEREDWGWMGFRWKNRTGYVRPVNNWNPWINSNILTATLILEEDPERRLRTVHKVMESLDAFVEPYPSDGGCDEGPSYWSRAGGSLFDTLELLHSATGGGVDVFDTPLVQEIGRYIYRTYIAGPYFINFADASARMSIEPPLVYRYGKAIGDEAMTGFAAFQARRQNYGTGVLPGNFGVFNRVLPALFTLDELAATEPAEPLVRDVWLPDLQVMAARSEAGSRAGFYVAAKAGHNDESHNHNDVGNLIVYHDGRPVLVDAGAQTYTRQTFSKQRYELWNNQSAYHNVPTINGVMQREGRTFEARDVHYESDEDHARFSLDLAGAYPEEAAVVSWRRTVTLHRGRDVEIEDAYSLARFIEPFTLNFLTPLEPEAVQAGIVRLTDPEGGAYDLRYDPEWFEPAFETIAITDGRMSSNWGPSLNRVVLTSLRRGRRDSFRIRIVEV